MEPRKLGGRRFVRQARVKVKVGNLYLNEASVDEDLNMLNYRKIRVASGMNKANRKDFDAGLLGPVKVKRF